MLELVSPVDGAFTHFTEGASAIVNDYLDLVHARDENVKLRDELTRVKSDQARLAELEVENQHLGDLLELKDALGTNAVAANVIGSDASGLSRTLIVASGTDEGLRPGMAVIANQGVVGKLIAVSPHAARVLLINDHNSALDAFDQRTRARGIVAGLVDDGVILKYADRSQDIQRRRHDRNLGPGRDFPARPAGRDDPKRASRRAGTFPRRQDHAGGRFPPPRAGAWC